MIVASCASVSSSPPLARLVLTHRHHVRRTSPDLAKQRPLDVSMPVWLQGDMPVVATAAPTKIGIGRAARRAARARPDKTRSEEQPDIQMRGNHRHEHIVALRKMRNQAKVHAVPPHGKEREILLSLLGFIVTSLAGWQRRSSC
jgi:hypothetical protein